ncbi:MFS transporter [Hoeflea prorocentri]|uniref:MFS transporter n=1 Tax=Hoeflea prorocentri TaxID=1922333 RepID=A0A9X3ZH98_9HYPH|nr:MFS transporter [Hoeflea prorocentri]MCY6381089.1 MFS transporter [Hoeflea prorocentri]MDA5398889.1 MFS transporter [Hoeflea prorocentri]
MNPIAKFALLAVVFVDLIGQGLVFPIINELVMAPQLNFLPVSSTEATRHFDYGLVIGIFFLCWFFGGVYVAKLSDTIGRKKAIMICLLGALVGYMITIAALFADSLWLLILGRGITGFTAGNQPIAQAAMIDASRSDEEKARNMGYIVTGISAGLVGGPIIGGLLSDPAILGSFASIKMPFYGALFLVFVTILLVQFTYKDLHPPKKKLEIRPLEVFTQLVRIREKPVVMRLYWVFLSFMSANVTFYIFMDNYLSSRFQIGLFGTSMAMMVLGIALASSSTFLVTPVLNRFGKLPVIVTVVCTMAVSSLLFIVSPAPAFCYLFIATFYFGFGIAYPALLGLFSASVPDDEQGWVMGITTAAFTLAAGVFSLLGGLLMAVDIRTPFYICVAAALLALVLIRATWRNGDIRALAGS